MSDRDSSAYSFDCSSSGERIAFFWARMLAQELGTGGRTSTSRFRIVRSTSCRIWVLSSDSWFTATYATASMEPIRIAERTSILWASLRFFTVVTRDPVAIEGDRSGGNGQILFDRRRGTAGGSARRAARRPACRRQSIRSTRPTLAAAASWSVPGERLRCGSRRRSGCPRSRRPPRRTRCRPTA